MRTLLTLFCATALTIAAAASALAQPLLGPEQLDSLRQSPTVRIVDVRSRAAYQAGHVPGAVSAPYPEWRGPASNPGKLPPIPELASLVGRLGVAQGTHAVLVSSGADRADFGAAARVYWTLAYLGVPDVSILNGGMKAWSAAHLAETKDVPSIAPVAFAPHLNESIIAKTPTVAAQLGDPTTLLLDARPLAYFLGKEKAPSVTTPGTIKGAVDFSYSNWFEPGTATFVTPARAREIAAALHAKHPSKETISFCNTGHWASIDWFALSEIAGEKDVRLYPQSLAGWTKDPALPMANVPSRGEQLWNDVRGAFAR